jgi:protein-S-isoprenylcysteine O-methyltransferase Ste14
MTTWIFSATAVVGLVLLAWATVWNPAGATCPPSPLPPVARRITGGPYRWLDHPMYVGEWLVVVGCAGLAAGIWNAIAVGVVAELLLREWAMRETQNRKVSQ